LSLAPFLLDTCAVLWAADDQLPDAIGRALSDAYRNALPTYVSPISAWEIGLLASRGRFRSTASPARWFRRFLEAPGVELAELSVETLVGSSFLPGAPPRDPADRIIIATAREHDLTLVTRDREILAYAKDGHLRALEC
jgi:PIN domain nuclease of toxin-antitoxin system